MKSIEEQIRKLEEGVREVVAEGRIPAEPKKLAKELAMHAMEANY